MRDAATRELLELLEKALPITERSMFGGVGLYHEGVFFALIAAARLYFRVDDATRGEYRAADSHPFQPFADKPSMENYWAVPDRVLGHRAELARWARRAVAAARAKAAARPRRPGKRAT